MEFTEESSGEQRSTFKKKKFNPYAYQVGLLFLFGLLWHENKWKNYSFGVKQANPLEYKLSKTSLEGARLENWFGGEDDWLQLLFKKYQYIVKLLQLFDFGLGL